MSLSKVGASLSTARHTAGLTQKAAAQASGLTQATISRYESGEHDASLSNLLLLAHAYGCTIGALVENPLRQITPENITDIYKSLDDITRSSTKGSRVTPVETTP